MHTTLVKQSYFLKLLSSGVLFVFLVNSVSTALAADANRPASPQNTVTASAVIVPAHVAELGFLISGIAKEVPVKEGDLVKAGQTLIVLDTPELEFAVIEAQAALRSVQSYADRQKYRRIKNRRNGKIFYDVIPAVYRQRADAKVQQAQATLELAQITLAEGTLMAPVDGTVTSLHIIPGEFVAADQAMITLATLDRLQVETSDLSERDITKIRNGAPVDIFVEALDEDFRGRVIGISPRADTDSGDTLVRVTIAFDEQPEQVLWGMTAEVTIEGEE
jgi:HlyD family secretion protein